MSLWRPDEVNAALVTYIETLVPRVEYITLMPGAKWRRCQVPVHLQAEAGGAAPLAFSLKDDPIAVVGHGADEINYQASVTLSYLYPLRPADADGDWRRAQLAGHALLVHLLNPTADAPAGITVTSSRATQLRRSPVGDGWMLCEITLTVVYDSPVYWS